MSSDRVHHRLDIGDVVVDRELPATERTEAIVINRPPKRAHEWTVSGRGTVADDNPLYSDDAAIVCVVYRDTLEDHYPYYSGVAPLQLSHLHREGVKFYAFPEPRLICTGAIGPIEFPLSEIRPAPYHARNFNVDDNRAFIDEIAERGQPKPYPLVRVREGRNGDVQIVNGHKRVWAASVAGLESIPCHTVHQNEEEYVRAWARRHLDGYDHDEQAVAIDRLQEAGFGNVATDYATVEADGGSHV